MKSLRLWTLFALGLMATAESAFAAQVEPHPFGVRDLLAMERISDPQLSPSGQSIAFTLRTTDLEANRGRTDLWLVGSDGTGLRKLTDAPEADHHARWSPDGRWLYFLSSRGGSSQVWRLDPSQPGIPQPEPVTRLPLDVSGFAVSPTGSHLAVAVEAFPDCSTLQCSADRFESRKKAPSSGRIYDRLFVRHWDSWKEGSRSQLFVVPTSGGDAVAVLGSFDADVPSKPFGGMEEVSFTPDGRQIVFTARLAGREEAWSTNFDLWAVPVDASAPPRRLTSNPAWDTQPKFSPDGKTLAYLAMARPGYESDRFQIVLREGLDGPERKLAPDWDRSPDTVVWSPDGKLLYATAQDVGQTSLFAIEVLTGKVRTLRADGTHHWPMPLPDGRIAYGRDHLRGPTELYLTDPNGEGETRLTRINDDRVAQTKMGNFFQMSFRGAGNDTVYAYLGQPIDFDPTRKYPVAFLIHGGPQGSFSNNFHYRWNPQVYAARGYAVVMVDFHGSTGYGQAFTDSIRGDWGGKPLEDLKLGLKAALDAHPWMDGDRVVALGASYGGWMIHWIHGQWPGRFRALVAHAGFLDTRNSYFTTEELWFPEWEFLGTPWEKPQEYARFNPIEHVHQWRTPTLITHGALDFRVVETDGLGAFTALQRQGIPSRLLYFPDENHWILKPQNSILWHETVLEWIDRWTGREPVASADGGGGAR